MIIGYFGLFGTNKQKLSASTIIFIAKLSNYAD